MPWWWLAIACSADPEGSVRTPSDDDPVPDETDAPAETDEPVDTDVADTEPPEDTDDVVPTGPCPDGMVLVDDAFCIDRAEAALEVRVNGTWTARSPYDVVSDDEEIRAVVADGLVPQGYVSGLEAQRACEGAGKRLCSSDEWLLACRGPANTTYPYGNTYDGDACNDTYPGGHPVVDYFGTSDGIWDGAHMNDPGINQQPDTVDEGGANPGCVSAWGAFDLHGNLHEWVDDADGTFRGGFYADGSINGAGCTYRTGAHSIGYHDYSTGFRCCADL